MNGVPETLTVADVPVDPVPCVPETATLGDVASVLAASSLGTVVVRTDPLTVVTDRDVVSAVAAGHDAASAVSGLELPPPVLVTEWTPLLDVVSVMFERNLRSVVLVGADNRVSGLVSAVAVVRALLGGPPWLGALRLALHIEGIPR